eukprot:CAMPEP_0170591326 /NCGR_PEP_ID=MMETSP0224-20130122/12345_1 /TAXON_ID=285029 /ORGANISM="Togula jolla, Strain CCCM 725" /LENGTH=279 /DNA_ID=CAMNT_0010915185 /DNA_START=48 /DNA_END=887 /DNA_ORIENTATION=+
MSLSLACHAAVFASALALGSAQRFAADAYLAEPGMNDLSGVALVQVEAKVLPWPAAEWLASKLPWSTKSQDVIEDLPEESEFMEESEAQEVTEALRAFEEEQDMMASEAQKTVDMPEAHGAINEMMDAPDARDIIDMPEAQEIIKASHVYEDLEDQEPGEVPEAITTPEDQKAFLAPKETIVYAQFDNYCVSQIGAELRRDKGHSAPGGTADCKAACNADESCSGFEWYQAGWKKGYQCFLIRGGGHARRGAAYTKKFRDANCFVKNLAPNGQVGLVED